MQFNWTNLLPTAAFSFFRFVNGGEVVEDLLFCNILKLHCRGEDIFNSLDGFFRDNSLSWENCAEICTDGAANNDFNRVRAVRSQSP